MKTFKNLVIGGIENKVVNLILITIIVISAAFMGMTLYQNKMLEDVNEETIGKQQQALTDITNGIMNDIVDQSMDQTTELKAQMADEVFHNLAVRVEMMGEYAGKLFQDPSSVGREEYAAPDKAQDGQIVCQTILADGVNEEEIADRIGLAANMTDMMSTLFGASADTNSCFIALPEGAFLVVDDRSGSKFSESGERVIYDCRTRPWYKQAVEKESLIFTDVEVDAFTGDIGIVCAMPVYANGELVAVVGSDLFLNSMNEAIQSSESNGGFECVINSAGHVILSPKESGIFRAVESANATDLRTNSNSELASMVVDAMKGNTGVRLVHMDGGTYYMAGSPIGTLGWTLLYVFDQAMADKPAEMLTSSYQTIQEEAGSTYLSKMGRIRMTMRRVYFAIVMLAIA